MTMRSPWALAALGVVAMLFGAALLWTIQRAAPGSLDPTDRARVETVVRDYVLAHPDLIPQAMQKLRERETGEVIAANRAAILAPFGSAWAGNPRGDVTLVEYFDYNCGYCRASLPTIARLIASDRNLRVVYRELPILSEESGVAARVSLAAAAQGRFQAFHDALYAGGRVTPQSIAQASRAAGLNEQAAAAMAPQADAEILANRQLAAALGMTGTPSWVIGNRVVSNALPFEEMQKAIAAARAGA